MIDIINDNLKNVAHVSFIPWNDLKGKAIFITGATGLIGRVLVKALCLANQELDLHIRLILLVRDIRKAERMFSELPNIDSIHFVVGNVESEMNIDEPVDYIIHGASQTASREFVNHAVETIHTTVYGVDHALMLAREKNVKSFVFLSSMEVYGYPERGHMVSEEEIGTFSPLNLRNSYPISKIMGEMLCFAYAKEYCIPARIIRLTQIIGQDTDAQDPRFSAYLQRCAAEKKDIVLKTSGKTERCYLDVTDAVTAILTVLLKGKNGEVYNAADEKTYCSISALAKRVAAEHEINVIFDHQKELSDVYLKTLYINLNTYAIRALGWKPLRETTE